MVRLASLTDMSWLVEHDRHIRPEELEHLVGQDRVYMIEGVGWLRYNLFWDTIPFMNMLYILEPYRGEGYGRQLVKFWERNMRALGHERVMTSTAANEYAQHFYRKLGYVTIGGFVPQGEEYEILLSKEISDDQR